jgi:BMFP domain-containing protein YqiC
MQSENRFFDDLAKMVNGVAGTVAGAGREAEAAMRERAKEWVGRMDFVSREEFEAVKQMAATARAETEALKARLDKLEGVAKPAAAVKAAAAKPAATPKAAAKPVAAPKAAAKPKAAPKT